LSCPVHDGTVRLDRASDHIVVVLELDDDDLGSLVALLVPDADIVI
jgi:hypothetical protein